MCDIDRLIGLAEDKAALEQGLRVIMYAAETKELPPEGLLPTFGDGVLEEMFVRTLEKVAGGKY